ncbi:AAEL007540-PA [Aedes aegypti]|uniref:AAEL007540-PA n=1 Tax=Aedes aegypti TaxID=7159 RepID=Q171T0_AEDAE|nr:AAEL007540-PA [Aedes aegypti]
MWEQLLEDLPVVVSLLGWRRVDGESCSRGRKLGITDVGRRVLGDGIDPRVTNSIGKLLLLSPEDFLRKIILSESFPQDVLLHGLYQTVDFVLGLAIFRADAHHIVDKVRIQEGDTQFQAPCGSSLVCTKTICVMEVLHTLYRFEVEFFCIWRLMKVEVSSE